MDGISEKIRQIKKERGMTAKELSEKSGIPVATLNRVLAGKGKSVKTDKLAALADALGVRTSDLIESGAGIVFTASAFLRTSPTATLGVTAPTRTKP